MTTSHSSDLEDQKFDAMDARACQIELDRLGRAHDEVIEALREVNKFLPDLKKKIKGYVARHYKVAFDETKKNAGQETLEQWAGSKNIEDYELYVYWSEKFEELEKISRAYQASMSAAQSRLNFFKK